MAEEFPDIIELNVGGKLFTTSLTTLVKAPDSMLAAMFSGRHTVGKDKDGRYFIDCDGDVFAFILEYLRFGTVPSGEMVPRVLKYADYFNISALKDKLENIIYIQSKTEIDAFQAEPRRQVYNDVLEHLKSGSISAFKNLPLYVNFWTTVSDPNTSAFWCRIPPNEYKTHMEICVTPKQFQQLPLELCTDIYKMGYLVKYIQCEGNNKHFLILIAYCKAQEKPSNLDWTYCSD